MKIVLATSNSNKVKEINEILNRDDIEFILPPQGFDPIENGKTFEENALIKAKEANRLTGMYSLADDSGLCVEALDYEPGIHSARYAETPQARIEKLLSEIKKTKSTNRKAKFVCAMVLLDEKGNILVSTIGECHGQIAQEQKGQNGFGYDPVFIVDGTNKTMAELDEIEKNKISHRAKALQSIISSLTST